MLSLLRHVSTEWSGVRYCGRTDLGISATGRMQVVELVGYLDATGIHVGRVISSPALRCRQTAAAITERIGGDSSVDDRLRECDFGDAEGLRFVEVQRRWPKLGAALLREDPRVDWPGGETWSQFATRIDSAWHELSGSAGDVLVVTHGGPLRLMLASACASVSREALAVAPGGIVRLTRRDAWVVESCWSPDTGMHSHQA